MTKLKLIGLILTALMILIGGAIGLAGEAAPALKTASGAKAEAHNNAGIDEYNQGYWKEAHEHFMEAIESDPQSAEAHYNLALALDKMGEHKKAAQHFKQAADLGKDNPDIQNSKILKAHVKMLE